MNQDLNAIIEKRKSKLQLKLPVNAAPLRIINTVEKEKFVIDTWLASQPNQPLLMLNWDELFEDTENQLNILGEFINTPLDVKNSKSFISSLF